MSSDPWSGSYPPYQKRPTLTPQQRDEIKRRYSDGETAQKLALEFGVRAALIYTLCGRRS